ncbi:uncharacterized protein LOC116210454 isoform X2 [Punica granatum]|uniref:Uncharacterized protein LOC116210454 isoform X2 n=1 Tax=Punica granatum TaxID=22663 RepID=A0A6P8E0V8_PUNGR|nr:uncharacterized protein LOC116210454 isoform X2 [Punica granatum]
MALTCLRSPPRAMLPRSGPVVKPISRASLRQSQLLPPLRRARSSLPRIRSSFDNQVFEDGPEGIICYSDENGEIICEGYDEGPRLRPKISRTPCPPCFRDAGIIDMLQQNWIQIVKGSEVYQGLAVQEEGFKWLQ